MTIDDVYRRKYTVCRDEHRDLRDILVSPEEKEQLYREWVDLPQSTRFGIGEGPRGPNGLFKLFNIAIVTEEEMRRS